MDKRAKETLARHSPDFSSLDPKVVKNSHIQQVVADPEWQDIRSALKGTWKTTPEINVKILDSYLGDGTNPWKVRRVLNYMTGSGFRIGIIPSTPGIEKLTAKVRLLWKKMSNE